MTDNPPLMAWISRLVRPVPSLVTIDEIDKAAFDHESWAAAVDRIGRQVDRYRAIDMRALTEEAFEVYCLSRE